MRNLHPSFIAFTCAAIALPAAAQGPVVTENQVNVFEQIASYGVVGGIAEIVSASPDGLTLAYSDASGGRVGFVDATDPFDPIALPDFLTGGEPTSVSFAGNYVLAAVITAGPSAGDPAPDPSDPANAGALFVLDASDPSAVVNLGSIPIGFQPDSVKAFQRNGSLVAVVCIENEPIVVDDTETVLDEDLPGFPTSGPDFPQDRSLPGLIQVVTIDPANVTGADVDLHHGPESPLRRGVPLDAGHPERRAGVVRR